MTTSLREQILPNVKHGKNPDLRVDGEYVEVKSISSGSNRNIPRRITDASLQADIIIIDTPEYYAPGIKVLLEKFTNHPNMKTLQFRHLGKYYIYKREDYIK